MAAKVVAGALSAGLDLPEISSHHDELFENRCPVPPD
jgi:hypothetical protein